MLYGRIATGFRPGIANALPGNDVTLMSSPDETVNYEVGLKGSYFDGVLTVDTSIYHIYWRDIQYSAQGINGVGQPAYYSTNGEKATSQGIELAADWRPLPGLTVSGWVAFNEAELANPLPSTSSVSAPAGAALPYASEWSGRLSLEQKFPLWGSTDGYIAGTVTCVGDRLGPFASVGGSRAEHPAYEQVNLGGGIRWENWNLSLFVNNLSDERGELIEGLSGDREYIAPRIVGMSITKAF